MATIKVFDAAGKEQDLAFDINLKKKGISPLTFTQSINAYRQNWRQGTAACKTRSDVAFSNKKPWKQKGTGRARAGSARSPIWRSGGVTFGPQPRTRTLSLNKKQRALVFNNVFHTALDRNKINCLDFSLSADKPSTKQAVALLKATGFIDSKVVMFLAFNDVVNQASFRNIKNVTILFYDQPNAYDLSIARTVVFLKKDVEYYSGYN